MDPNAKNLVGATVLWTGEGGKYGCLMRLEPNYDTMVSSLLFSLSHVFLGLFCDGVPGGIERDLLMGTLCVSV